MKKDTKHRKELLNGDGPLEALAKKLYVERFVKVTDKWGWQSNIEWGLPVESSSA